MSLAPIGILDSGLGGMTIWSEIRRILPFESTVYVADHAYHPYGERSSGAIRRRVRAIIGFLLSKEAKLVVIACNTATVAGIDRYRQWFPHIPLIGVVPVVKKAAQMTKTGHFAVVSTPFTAASSYQKRLIATFADGCRVENIGVPRVAQMIESGELDEAVDTLLGRYLGELGDVDVVALGCTHYSFIRREIARRLGKQVSVIDSASAVARHVARVLTKERLRARRWKPYTEWYTTGDAQSASGRATRLNGTAVTFSYARI